MKRSIRHSLEILWAYSTTPIAHTLKYLAMTWLIYVCILIFPLSLISKTKILISDWINDQKGKSYYLD